MGSPLLKNYHYLLVAMALLAPYINRVIAQNSATISSNETNKIERHALLALSHDLNSIVLRHNWSRLRCNSEDPPTWCGIKCSGGRVSEIVLENMGLNGRIRPGALVNLTQLSVLSFKNNSIWGNIMNFSNNPMMRRIDLSSNRFDGPIPDSLLTLDSLESLLLQDNNLNGSIPAFNDSTLREFSVANNNLSGKIPDTKVLQSFQSSSFEGNPELCGKPLSKGCDPISNAKKGRSHSFLTALLIVFGVVGLLVIAFLVIKYCKKSRKVQKVETIKRRNVVITEVERVEKSGITSSIITHQESESSEKSRITDNSISTHQENESSEKSRRTTDNSTLQESERSSSLAVAGRAVAEEKGDNKLEFVNNNEMSFEINDLLKASAEGLGKGSFGSCYKAILNGGTAVVVKRLRDLKPLSDEEFLKLLQAIAHQKHPNLLPLVAYYNSRREKLLVYKFASKGNLYNRLHRGRGTKERIPFPWSERLSVAGGVARALEYLHLNPNSEPFAVPHGNLKSSNVVLDHNDTPLVTDYGLSSIIFVPIAAQRMVSFKTPEYHTNKSLSKKSDVWSYGSLLLELLTGRVSAHAAPPGINGVDLCSWVHRAVREEWTAEIFDAEITAKRSANHSMVRLLQIAVRCCDKSPVKRPEMADVVREVEDVKIVMESEDEEDSSSQDHDQSLTDDSLPATPALIQYKF